MKMRKSLSKILLLLAAVLFLMPGYAKAAEKIVVTLHPIVKGNPWNSVYKEGETLIADPGRITNIKTSKAGIITIKTDIGDGVSLIDVIPKKAGKTTLSYKLNGKPRKVLIEVKKYVNPVSYIKLGSTKLASSKFNKTLCNLKYSQFQNKKSKLNIKLKSGWKVAQLRFRGRNGEIIAGIQNGSTVKINQKGCYIIVGVYNPRTKQEECFCIRFA